MDGFGSIRGLDEIDPQDRAGATFYLVPETVGHGTGMKLKGWAGEK